MRKSTLLLPPLISFFLISCTTIPDQLPWVYRIDIQQGNIIDQDMIDQLRPDMTKRQVLYILGSPMLIDVFHQKRWDYIYSEDLNDKPKQQQRISLYFEDDILTGVQGDYRPSEIAVARVNTDSTVDVPKRQQKKTVFGEIVKFFTFSDDESTATNQDQEETQSETDNSVKKIETEEKPESSNVKEKLKPETPATDTNSIISEEIKEPVIEQEEPAGSPISEPVDSEQQAKEPETDASQQDNNSDTPVPEPVLNQPNEILEQAVPEKTPAISTTSEPDQPEPEAIEAEETVIEKSAEEIAEQEAKAKQEQEEKILKELEELTKPPVLKIPEQNSKQ